MRLLKKPLSILLSFLMIFSVFTIIPMTTASAAEGDTISAEVHKWIQAELVEGKYYKLNDLYTNFILVRTDPAQEFNYTFESGAIWNRTGDKALEYGKNKIVVNSFNDGSGNLNAYWDNDNSREGIYLSDELNNATAVWYVYTWETFTLTEHEAKDATCTEPGNVKYYTSGDRYFVEDENSYKQVTQAETVVPAGHTLTAHPAVDATPTTNGNTAYWSCDVCGKYFSDAEGTTEIEENSWVIPATAVAKVSKAGEEDQYYSDLQEAFNNVSENTTVTILKDTVLDSYIPIRNELILDLNGKNLSKNSGYVFTITTNGKLTIRDSSVPSTGKITSGGSSGTINVQTELILESGTIEHIGTNTGTAAVRLTIKNTAKFTMNGGTVTADLYGISAAYPNTSVTVNAGNVYGGNTALKAANKGANVTVTGGDFTCGSSGACLSSTGTVAVSGGTFSKPVLQEYCAEGFIPEDNGNGHFGVKKCEHPAASLTAHDAHAATCTEPGNSAYWSCVCGKYFSDADGENEIEENSWVIPAAGHDWDYDNPEWSTDVSEEYMFEYSTTVTLRCKNCTETKVLTAISGMPTEQDASCAEGGYTEATFIATFNGHTYTKTIRWNESAKDPAAHPFELTKTEAVAATCTTPGNSEYYYCGVCEKYFSDEAGEHGIAENSWVINALGHNMTAHAAVEATPTAAGNSAYWSCDRCGKFFSDENGENEIEENSWVIPAAGLAQVGETKYYDLTSAVYAALASGDDIYLLAECKKGTVYYNDFNASQIDVSSYFADPDTEQVQIKVHGNGFYGAGFMAKTNIASGPYINTWTISGSGKNAVYTYSIKPALVKVVRSDNTVIYPTALYQALNGMDSDCAQEGDTVVVLRDIVLDDGKSEVKVKYTGVTLDLNGKTVTGARENFLEVKDGNTLTVEGGTIGGTGSIKLGTGSTLALDNTTVSAPMTAGAGATITFANNAGLTGAITVPEDYKVVTDPTTGKKTVVAKNYVAQVGETKYETFAEAVTAAAGTETITLLANIPDTYTIAADETLKVALNGKNITVAAPENYILNTATAEGVTTYTATAALAKVGENAEYGIFSTLDAAVAAALSSGKDIYLLAACNKAPNNAFSGLDGDELFADPNTEQVQIKVHGNGFYGAGFMARTDVASGPYVNSWYINGSGKSAVYRYVIKPALVKVVRSDNTVIYPTALYQALNGMDSDCAQEGDTVVVLRNIELDDGKSEIKVKYTGVTLDLNGKTVTGARENFLEVKDGNTLNVTNGTIGGEGSIKLGAGSTLALDNTTVSAPMTAGAGATITFANNAGLTGDITVPEDYKVVTDPTTGKKTVVAKNYVAQIGETKYESLQEALDDASENDEIDILTDIDLTAAVFVRKKLTIDLNGHTITRDAGIAITVNTDGDLTIKDSGENGKITSGTKMSTLNVLGKLTLESGTIEHTGTGMGNCAVKLTGNTSFTMTGGTVTGQKYGVYCQNTNAAVTISDGAVYGKNASIHNAQTSNSYTISGGTFTTGENGKNFSGSYSAENTNVSGGNFSNPVPEAYCADNYIPSEEDSETHLYTVKEGAYVARVDGQGYETFAEAVTAAGETEVITLLADCEYTFADTGSVKISNPDNKTLTLDASDDRIQIAEIPLDNDVIQYAAIKFVGTSVTTGGSIGFNYFVDVPESVDMTGAAATYSWGVGEYRKNNVDGALTTQTVSGKVYYKVICKVTARSMTDDIAIVIKIGNTTIFTRDDYSVARYAKEVVKLDNLAHKDELKKMLCDMLNYGAQAQIEFEYKHEGEDADLASAHIAEVDPEWIETSAPASLDDATTITSEYKDHGVEFKGATMMLTSQTSIRLFFKKTGENLPEAKVNGVAVEWKHHNGFNLEYIEISNISAKNIFDDYTITIGGDEAGVYNAANYYNSAVRDEKLGDNMKLVMCKLYKYSTSAKAYLDLINH